MSSKLPDRRRPGFSPSGERGHSSLRSQQSQRQGLPSIATRSLGRIKFIVKLLFSNKATPSFSVRKIDESPQLVANAGCLS